MNKMPQTDYKKITQALNYFARKTPDKHINKLKAIKLVWIADRFHLRKYGRPITWDMYEAMKLGPVGSITKDIAELSPYLEDFGIEYATQYIKPINKYTYESKANVDTTVFSETDIEALDFAYKNFKDWDKYALKDFTHAYPEWSKYKESLESGMAVKINMDYIDFFNNPTPENIKNDIFKEDSDMLEVSKQIFERKQELLKIRTDL